MKNQKQEIKEKCFSVRCTEEEKEAIRKQAKKLKMTLSDYIVRTCLEQKKDRSTMESQQIINSLCSMQSSINRFKEQLISRKDFTKLLEKEIKQLWQH